MIADRVEQIELLAYCHGKKIPVFASLGAAAKSDPSRIQIASVLFRVPGRNTQLTLMLSNSDISTTFEDPLARSVRRRL